MVGHVAEQLPEQVLARTRSTLDDALRALITCTNPEDRTRLVVDIIALTQHIRLLAVGCGWQQVALIIGYLECVHLILEALCDQCSDPNKVSDYALHLRGRMLGCQDYLVRQDQGFDFPIQ